MSLAERLADLDPTVRCVVGHVLVDLAVGDRDALEIALANPNFSAREIVTALRAEGYSVGRTVLQEHRAGTCRCAE